MHKHPLGVNNTIGCILFIFLFLLFAAVFAPPGWSLKNERESPVVRAVRKVSPAVVNISSSYAVRKRANPFSGFGKLGAGFAGEVAEQDVVIRKLSGRTGSSMIQKEGCSLWMSYLLKAAGLELSYCKGSGCILNEGQVYGGYDEVSGVGVRSGLLRQYLLG